MRSIEGRLVELARSREIARKHAAFHERMGSRTVVQIARDIERMLDDEIARLEAKRAAGEDEGEANDVS